MTAKEYLKQARVINANIRNLMRIRENLYDSLYSYGVVGQDERVQSSPANKRLESLFAKIDERERQTAKETARLIDLKCEMTAKIEKLSDERYIKVLCLYYVECYTIPQTAKIMHYSESTVKRFRDTASQAFGILYRDEFDEESD